MHGRSSNNQNTLRNTPISFRSVQHKQPDRTFYIKEKMRKIQRTFSTASKELYNFLEEKFSFGRGDFHQIRKNIIPIAASGVAFLIGEWVTNQMSQAQTESDEYDFVYKFLLGSAIIAYSAMNRITDRHINSLPCFSAAVAAETLGITYLYMSTYRGSRMLLEGQMSDNYSLITSLATSALAIPGGISYLAQQYQERRVKKLYQQGAQRSDTVVISSGLTPIANTYFIANHFLLSEISMLSRLFQLGLISNNILNTNTRLEQLRNLPALIADVGPPTIKKLSSQKEKLDHDYKNNTAEQLVIKFDKQGKAILSKVKRHQLRTGDLVSCDDNFDLGSSPVSGEIVKLADEPEQKFSVNLKAQNGEDVWIELKSNLNSKDEYKQVDLHAIHSGKQSAVLTGTKINFHNNNHFFVRIKPEKERVLNNTYEKKPIINQIITDYKRKNVIFAFVSSIAMAALLRSGIDFPVVTMKLLFNLFQMLIPFSESFLREMVNRKLIRELNQSLLDRPMETMDALRIVDLCNALGGYYQDKFPQGVVIVSDKTGTLTTSKMNVLGFWTTDMPPNVQDTLSKEEKDFLLPDQEKQAVCFEVFASAFTNSKKDLEPEESAIKGMFEQFFGGDALQIETIGSNHFKKKLLSDKSIETRHLGLYSALGGRLTLVTDNGVNYLVFCGVPRVNKFKDTQLFNAYSTMNTRRHVLSRDWCVARAKISSEQFEILEKYFSDDNKKEIEKFVLFNTEIMNSFVHHGTFLIDNPIKKEVEKFIFQCREANVPIFIATGDTAKSAENITSVLYPADIQKTITIRATDKIISQEYPANSVVIFAGINDEILQLLNQLMKKEKSDRPAVIFSEMSIEGKGVLTQFLKKNGFFVVANGDGTNDIAMMKHADVVVAHLTDDGTYAPGVEQFADLNDRQLQNLFNSQESFYKLFDVHQSRSLFIEKFSPLANSQEKPSIALLLKSGKIGFELARAVDAPNVIDMPHQHWFSTLFDMIWVWISFHEINNSTDLPADSKHLGVSSAPVKYMLTALSIATLEASILYATTGESVNLTTMLLWLSFLPLVLKSLFSSYGFVQKELSSSEEKCESGLFNFSCFNRNNKNKREDSDNILLFGKHLKTN